VRELENVIERAVLINPGPEINTDSLFTSPVAVDESPISLRQATNGAREIVEREKIAHALERAKGNRSEAAKLLGISRSALYNKLRVLDLAH
jgi:DNA-binding NtrC family response regulator